MRVILKANKEDKQVDIYRLSTDEIKRIDKTGLEKVLPERMKRAERFRHENDRLLCIGGGYLIWNYLGLKDEVELKTNEYGKPYAKGYPDFSISHSGEMVVFVKCDEHSESGESKSTGAVIGIDIEIVKERNLKVAEKVFTPLELEWMKEDTLRRFHILWTRKESVMKAMGRGFKMPFKSFEVIASKLDGKEADEIAEEIVVEGRRLYIKTICEEDYMISVSSSALIGEIKIVDVKPKM